MSISKYVTVAAVKKSGKDSDIVIADTHEALTPRGQFTVGETAIWIPEGYEGCGLQGPVLIPITPGHKWGRDLDAIVHLEEALMPGLEEYDLDDPEPSPELPIKMFGNDEETIAYIFDNK